MRQPDRSADNPTAQLTAKEELKYGAVKLVLEGKIAVREAAERMGVSTRQAQRIVARVLVEGEQGVIHRLKGRSAPNGAGSGPPLPDIIRAIHAGEIPPTALDDVATRLGYAPTKLRALLARLRL